MYFGQRFFLQNLVAIGHFWAIWPLVDPRWPLLDRWPQQYITLWPGVLSTKSGGHRAFLSNLTSGWPLHDFQPQQCITLWSGVLSTKFGCRMAFLRQIDLRMTFDLWWGCFENMLSNLGAIPYPHAKFQLDSLKHDKTHSLTYTHTPPTPPTHTHQTHTHRDSLMC